MKLKQVDVPAAVPPANPGLHASVWLVAADALATANLKRKLRYREIPAEDMDTLVRYLAALKSSR